jgi:hypothetical protein
MGTVSKIKSGNEGGEGETPLSATGPAATEIPSNAYVTGNMNSQFRYAQTDDGPFQEMSKGASVKPNKYLEKIAMSVVAKGVGKAFNQSSNISKASLGLSSVGLGLSAANYMNGRATAQATQDKANLERRSLTALNRINTTLSTATMVPSPIAVKRPV